MKKNWIIICLVLILPIAAYFFLSKSDVSYAQKSNDMTNKPQIIKFTSKMCMDCKKVDDLLKEIFPKYSEDIVLIEVPVQSDKQDVQDKIEKYNVTLVPTMIMIKSDGKQYKRIEGYVEREEMEKYLKALING